MSPFSCQHTFTGSIVGSRRLCLADRGGRFEPNAEVDWCAVGDAALDAAAEIRLGR